MHLCRGPFQWPCGSDEAIHAVSPDAACPWLLWKKPLDAAIGQLLAPYHPGSRQGDSKQNNSAKCVCWPFRWLWRCEMSFRYCDYLRLWNFCLLKNCLSVPTLCKHLCTIHFAKAWKFLILALQITWRHDRNSNKSHLVTSRYSFPFRRKWRRNW